MIGNACGEEQPGRAFDFDSHFGAGMTGIA